MYNRCLELNKQQYEKNGTFVWPRTKNTGLSYMLPRWREEHPWLTDPPAQALHERIGDIGKALARVKPGRKGSGFPKFRSRHIEHHQTLRFPHNWTEKNPKGNITPTACGVWLPKMPGRIRWTKHRPLTGRLKSVTVKRENNCWFAVCLCELEDVPPRPPTSEAEVLGIDPGLKTFAVCSDGTAIPTPRYYRSQEKRLKRLQRQLSKKQGGKEKGRNNRAKAKHRLNTSDRGSGACSGSRNNRAKAKHRLNTCTQGRISRQGPTGNNRAKAKHRLNTLHYRVKCRRKDDAHKQSTAIAKRARFVGVEDLNVKGMARNRHLAKSVHDQGMSMFLSLLPYKVEARGGEVIRADRFYASSKTCSQCGQKKEGLTLSDRVYRCDACGLEMDRDRNAAINLRMVAVNTLRSRGHWRTAPPKSGENACGDTADVGCSHESPSHVSPKQEIACSSEEQAPKTGLHANPKLRQTPGRIALGANA